MSGLYIKFDSISIMMLDVDKLFTDFFRNIWGRYAPLMNQESYYGSKHGYAPLMY